MKYIKLSLIVMTLLSACQLKQEKSDAYGNFEAEEIMVSAEASGQVKQLNLEEGDELKEGAVLGYIDTTQISLKKLQLQAQIDAVMVQLTHIDAQVEVLKTQEKVLQKELNRANKLLKDKALPTQKYDDLEGQMDVLEAKIKSTMVRKSSVLEEKEVLEKQMDQLDLQVENSVIKSPAGGHVLTKYIHEGEFIVMGKPIFKMANMNQMYLRAYVSGSQLPHIKTGQQVEVLIDKNESENQSLKGRVTWIADQAEFTPKIIQTKEERVDLVYAIKVRVENDGRIKIGMPGEVNFKTSEAK